MQCFVNESKRYLLQPRDNQVLVGLQRLGVPISATNSICTTGIFQPGKERSENEYDRGLQNHGMAWRGHFLFQYKNYKALNEPHRIKVLSKPMDVFCHAADLLPAGCKCWMLKFYMKQWAATSNAQVKGFLKYSETSSDSESWRLGKC